MNESINEMQSSKLDRGEYTLRHWLERNWDLAASTSWSLFIMMAVICTAVFLRKGSAISTLHLVKHNGSTKSYKTPECMFSKAVKKETLNLVLSYLIEENILIIFKCYYLNSYKKLTAI